MLSVLCVVDLCFLYRVVNGVDVFVGMVWMCGEKCSVVVNCVFSVFVFMMMVSLFRFCC